MSQSANISKVAKNFKFERRPLFVACAVIDVVVVVDVNYDDDPRMEQKWHFFDSLSKEPKNAWLVKLSVNVKWPDVSTTFFS